MFGFDAFEILLGIGILYMAWLLYMIEENIDYSRNVIDKDNRD
jgi:hypothetical protein